MKRYFGLLVLMLFSTGIFAQKKLMVQGTFPDIYILHKVSAKENLTIVSNLYNLTVMQLAKANAIEENAYIAIGKDLKIPLSNKNFTQDGQMEDNETLIPIHYIVQKGENLFRIAQNFGKVRMDFIREWNDLNSETIQPEQKIVIGHLKALKEKENQILAGGGIIKKNTTTTTDETTGYGGTTTDNTKKTEPTNTSNKTVEDEGYFVTQYPTKPNGKNLIKKNGEAATFKTTSGWADRKYYALMNNVTPGTIVRITTANNKSICAKVLGALPEMKENNGLIIRLSNASASALGISDAKFAVNVSFYNSY